MSTIGCVGQAQLRLQTVAVERQRLEKASLFRKQYVKVEVNERHWMLIMSFHLLTPSSLEGQTVFDLGVAPKDSRGQIEHGASEESYKKAENIITSIGLEKPWWVDLTGTTLFDYLHEKQADLNCDFTSEAIWQFVPRPK